MPENSESNSFDSASSNRSSNCPKTHLLLFTMTNLGDMLKKGNISYVRNYESYFDRVTIAYLSGTGDPIEMGRTKLVPIGTKKADIRDLFVAPFRLYRMAKKIEPTLYLTADQWYLWWTSILLRWFLKAKIVLIPVSMPEQLYQSQGVTVSGYSYTIDRLLRRLSFACASYIWTGRACGNYIDWLSNDPWSKNKLFLSEGVVEAMPTVEFLKAASETCRKRSNCSPYRLIYIGRLAKEKFVDDLIRVMEKLPSDEYRFVLVGDGPERGTLETLASELGVRDSIEFHGAVANLELPKIMSNCDAFVSTLTGTSLREACFMGLPIIAYDRDWVHGFLEHERNVLFVKDRDIDGLAAGIRRLKTDRNLSLKLSQNAKLLADELWSTEAAYQALHDLQNSVSPVG